MRTNYRVVASISPVALLVVIVTLTAGGAATQTKHFEMRGPGDTIPPCVENYVHKVGKVHFSITNWGMIGSTPVGTDNLIDPETDQPAPSCEYPAGSGNEYLYAGGLWVGARVGTDTLTSTGYEGWYHQFEMFSAACPDGKIVTRSSDPDSADYSPDAVSDRDYIATYSDTAIGRGYVHHEDDWDHMPIGLHVRQTSLAWGQTSYEDFVILEYTITNIGGEYLSDVAAGLLVDADIDNPRIYSTGFQDDITGSIDAPFAISGHTVPVAWAADNDGDPYDGAWADSSRRAVLGVCLLDCSFDPTVSYNWWMSGECYQDWGPHDGVAPESDTGCTGAPRDDAMRWERLTNGERDFDQIWSGQTSSGKSVQSLDPSWLRNFADGYDTKFLYSMGKVDLAPGDSLSFAVVVAMGDNFHTNPDDFANLFDYQDPDIFYQTLNFSDLLDNVQSAKALYDYIGSASGTPVIEGSESLPKRFAVSQNRPNPFNNSTMIEFSLDRPSAVTFEVYNILGEKIWSEDVKAVPGRNVISWSAVGRNGVELPSGVYFYRLVAGESSTTRKMLLLK